jgi:hypothetical protein
VQRRIAAMESASFIRRKERRKGSNTNRYHLDGLIKAAQSYAEEKLQQRAECDQGQSGNPSGHSGEYGKVMRLARQAAPHAV